MSGLAQAASPPHAAGQISPARARWRRSPPAAPPRPARSSRRAPSSPSTVKRASASARKRPDGGHQAQRDRQIVVAAFLRQIGGGQIDCDATGGQRQPEAINAARTRSRASATALSGRPTMAKAGIPPRPAPARRRPAPRCLQKRPLRRVGPFGPSAIEGSGREYEGVKNIKKRIEQSAWM